MFSLGIIIWESSALDYPGELTDEKRIDDGTLKYSIIKGHGKRKVRKSVKWLQMRKEEKEK